MSENEAQRRPSYSEFLRAAIPEGEWTLIREAVQRGQLTGPDCFVEQFETILGKRIGNGAGMGSVIVGTLYAIVDGAIAGAVFGWLYNLLSRQRQSGAA